MSKITRYKTYGIDLVDVTSGDGRLLTIKQETRDTCNILSVDACPFVKIILV